MYPGLNLHSTPYVQLPTPPKMRFTVYQRVLYGPIGNPGQADWRYKLIEVGWITADDEIEAVANAKQAGYVAPIVEPWHAG